MKPISVPDRRLTTYLGRSRLAFGVAVLLTIAGARARAATVTVTSLTDSGGCSLREAVLTANARSGTGGCTYAADANDDQIVFSVSGTHTVSSGLTVLRGMTIAGISRTATIIRSSATCTLCFFGDPSGANMRLLNLTVQYAGGASGLVSGIRVDGNATSANVEMENVRVTGYTDAGVFVEGTGGYVHMTRSTIENNRNGVSVDDSSVNIDESTVQNNTAHGVFAVYAGDFSSGRPATGSVFISRGNILNNRGTSGAGIFVQHTGREDGFPDSGSCLLLVEQSTISGNVASTGDGGGVFADGRVCIGGTTLSNNKADNAGGGAIFGASAEGGRILLISYSTLRDNTAKRGGAINVSPAGTSGLHLYMFASTIGPNNSTKITTSSTGDGGGIYSDRAQLERMQNVTISNNTAAGRGGGIFHQGGGELQLEHTTITYNKAGTASGGGGVFFPGTTNKVMYNIFAANTAAGAQNNFQTTLAASTTVRYNLLDSVSGAGPAFSTTYGNRVQSPTPLSALKTMDGPTQVVEPLSGSAAFNAIPSTEGDLITEDQRGHARSFPKDIGALEVR